jgi:hypothetical protein
MIKTFILLGLLTLISADICNQKINTEPVVEFDPIKNGEVPNGQAYIFNDGKNLLHLLKLKGTAYEMGYAYG